MVPQDDPAPLPGNGRPEDLRRQRLAQIHRLTEEQFAAEVRRHQASRWRAGRFVSHARAHAQDFEEALSHTLSPPELEALSQDILQSWQQLFTELQQDGITYYFLRSLPSRDAAIIVVTRGGFIRTTFPAQRLAQLWQRRPAAIEVTDRAKRLGLAD